MDHNQLFKASLRDLSVMQLHDLLNDIKVRIGDGVLSNHPEYVESQKQKAELIQQEMQNRLDRRESKTYE